MTIPNHLFSFTPYGPQTRAHSISCTGPATKSSDGIRQHN